MRRLPLLAAASFYAFGSAFLLPSLKARADLLPVPTPQLGEQCDDLDADKLAAAIERELPGVRKMTTPFNFGGKSVAPSEYAARTLQPLLELAQQGSAALCAALPKRFAFYRNSNSAPGKFTAYYNPTYRASRTRQGPYEFPLYRRPPGALASLSTAEILDGKLDGQGLELVYLADMTEANSIQVEGSATLLFDDGTTINVSSDGHNGKAYQNVSKLLLADNKIPKNQETPLGMTRARKYFIDNPTELPYYWSKNPHFVFFKESPNKGGGKFGELVDGRSLAVDVHQVPLGLAAWIRTDKPIIADNKVASWASYGRVAFAQDTGAGIVGAGRVDVFYGSSEYAQQAAAVITRPGELYVLLAR